MTSAVSLLRQYLNSYSTKSVNLNKPPSKTSRHLVRVVDTRGLGTVVVLLNPKSLILFSFSSSSASPDKS